MPKGLLHRIYYIKCLKFPKTQKKKTKMIFFHRSFRPFYESEVHEELFIRQFLPSLNKQLGVTKVPRFVGAVTTHRNGYIPRGRRLLGRYSLGRAPLGRTQ